MFFLAALALTGCGGASDIAKGTAEDISAVTEPAVLEAKGGKIDFTLTTTFPKAYINPYSLVVITPVIVFGGGERTGEAFIYQGENVKANYRLIKNKGCSISEKLSFDYTKGMEQCYLELRPIVIVRTKRIELPAVKVSDGCILTSQLADLSGKYSFKPDGYSRIVHDTTSADIFYDVNSSVTRQDFNNRQTLRDYRARLEEMKSDERVTVRDARIKAYASPEGGEEFNAKLSDRRAESAVKTLEKISSGNSFGEMEVESSGQDWEGFKASLAASNIEDKELILRILSMYDDPALRESEMRNLSHIYGEMKKAVFPGLRRATIEVTSDYRDYSDDELREVARVLGIGNLSVTHLLHLAAIETDMKTKEFYYRFGMQIQHSPVASYNLSVCLLDEDRTDVAEVYLVGMPGDTDMLNVKGVIEMRRKHYDAARKLFEESGTAESAENIATLDIVAGNYEVAAAALKGTGSANEALALILAGRLDEASAAIAGSSPRDEYLRAVIAARKGDAEAVAKHLEAASADENLAFRRIKDAEFAAYR